MNGKIFLYLACMTLPFDSFPFNFYHLGSAKPLALIFLIMFFIANIFNLPKIKFIVKDKLAFVILLFALALSFSKGLLEYHTLHQFSVFINSIFGFFIVYISVILIVNLADENDYEKIKTFIIIGYIFAFLVGICQFITINFKVTTFDSIYPYILRDVEYVKQGRIHFNFGEPSYIGGNIFLVMVPMIRFVSEKRKKLYTAFVIAFYILAMSSFSMQLFIDTAIFTLIYIFFNKTIALFKKVLVFIVFVITIGVVNQLFIQNNYFDISSPFYYRIISNLKSQSLYDRNAQTNDQSLDVRVTLAESAFKGFMDKPIVGYGLGYFNESYKENVEIVNPYWDQNQELISFYEKESIYPYMFYFSMLNEAGILGAVLLYLFFEPMFKSKKQNKQYMLLALYFLVQSNLFGSIPIMMVCVFYKYSLSEGEQV